MWYNIYILHTTTPGKEVKNMDGSIPTGLIALALVVFLAWLECRDARNDKARLDRIFGREPDEEPHRSGH